VANNKLRKQLNNIATSFKFSGARNKQTNLKEPEAIICAVPILFGRDVEANKAVTGHTNTCPNSYSATPEVKRNWLSTLTEINQLAK